MKGGNIKTMLDRFANENWNEVVTSKMVKVWIEQTYNVKLPARRIGQELNKHSSFVFIKVFNNRNQYRIANPLENWMKGLMKV